MLNVSLATGTIKNMVTRCADLLLVTYERIRQIMINPGLIHCDETGTRADRKTYWVHYASDTLFAFRSISKKHGQVGMEEAGILPFFSWHCRA